VRPDLPTASAGSSQAPTAAVDNSAPLQTSHGLFIYRGKNVQTSGATSSSNPGRFTSSQDIDVTFRMMLDLVVRLGMVCHREVPSKT